MFGFNRPFISRASRFGATHPGDPDYDEGPEEEEEQEPDDGPGLDDDDEFIDDERLDYIA